MCVAAHVQGSGRDLFLWQWCYIHNCRGSQTCQILKHWHAVALTATRGHMSHEGDDCRHEQTTCGRTRDVFWAKRCRFLQFRCSWWQTERCEFPLTLVSSLWSCFFPPFIAICSVSSSLICSSAWNTIIYQLEPNRTFGSNMQSTWNGFKADNLQLKHIHYISSSADRGSVMFMWKVIDQLEEVCLRKQKVENCGMTWVP